MGRFVRRALCVLAALALTLGSGIVLAQAQPLPVATGISARSATSAGLQTMATYDARGMASAAANAGYYSRPVLVQPSTVGGLARGLLRRAWPVAIMVAAVEAAGWAINELTGQVMSQPPPAPYTDGWYCANAGDGKVCAPTRSGLVGACCFGNAHYIVSISAQGNGVLENGGGATIQFYATEPVAYRTNGYNPHEITDAEWMNMVKAKPHLWPDLLHNPDGSVNRNPDVQAGAQALANELASTNPATQPNPSAEWDSGWQEGDAEGEGGAEPMEFPEFCAWASIVCELADWVMDDPPIGDQPPDDELPLIEPELTASWSSGLGGGSCPAPVEVEVMGADVVFPLQPMCDMASFIRPLVLAFTALLCVYIVAGVRRAS